MNKVMTKSSLDRPKVTLKIASSLDGRIATSTGQSQWITSAHSRARVHQMRADHDCVLTGIGTLLADNPELTARLEMAPVRQPLRAVLDTYARTPQSARLVATQNLGPVRLFHGHDCAQTFDFDGVARSFVDLEPQGKGLNLSAVLGVLYAECGVQTVMVEAGSQVAGAFLRAGLVDSLVWFRAPIIIGGDGFSVFDALGVDTLNSSLAFDCINVTRVGIDLMETYQAPILV
jgi:diaminohydroxyphosphoribosylaminopyrimidine deaminase / 5-amino-6-(5-phosphoribosylamino)uracil reductase